ncbi:ATP-binding protein [Labedaea rhizosphaerae]|uniref:Tetratricopeptide repeat protein n=1 Tax=Labedaea rhizosphaerae TaxID=598644 RepID=A0A4R6S584_LABRH|nr:tetratricopeptide repeat protein [Labedaea rhizosphaerae]TDP94902.1 tetratricopeptide repeat protein [Labedaea rhizosphaerae]
MTGPDPDGVGSLDDLARELDLLRCRAAVGTAKPRVSLTDLASRVGLPRSTVHTYVSGRTLAPAEVLDRIVIALGATPQEQARWGEAWYRVAVHGRPAVEPAAVPRQLPVDIAAFTGRADDLAALDRLAAADGPGICVITGTAGVGKSALAVHWAHRVAERFPDGQLHANLRGYDPEQPVAPGQVLGWFLGALGVSPADQPRDPAERAARYRTAMAGRRMLVVLDNARSAEHVRELLPGEPNCLVVITSRDALTGLVAREGARRLDLDLLPEADAIALLATLVPDRAEAEPAAVAALADQCARLPLALRIAAEHARNHPDLPLGTLVHELRDERHRLDLLDAGGDARTEVRAVLSWSYRQLNPAAARLFELLGPLPGADFDAYAAAALLGTDLVDARTQLDTLRQAHLLQTPEPGRFAMHDLLRAYAIELCAGHDDEVRAAIGRLLDHYQHAATQATDLLYPSERGSRAAEPVPRGPGLATPADARAWLGAERANLLNAIVHAAKYGWPAKAGELASTLWRDLESRGRNTDAVTAHEMALEAARAAGDREAEATALRNLSTAYRNIGDYDASLVASRLCLDIRRVLGDETGEAAALNSIAITYGVLCRFDEATKHYDESLAIRRATGNRRGEGAVLQNLAVMAMRTGQLADVPERLHAANALFREVGDRLGEAHSLNNLGGLHRVEGRYAESLRHHHDALAIYREIDAKDGEADALNGIALDHAALGELDDAVGWHEQALAVVRVIGQRTIELDILNSYGETLAKLDRVADSRAKHEVARELAATAGDRYELARALRGIGLACRASGDEAGAVGYLTDALDLFTELALPDAAEVRADLGKSLPLNDIR